jgi:hypothetical protein
MNGPTTHETLRQARQLMISVLRAPFKLSHPDIVFPKGKPEDWQGRKVLPPFLGEMGYEIRYFLAAVEPWLRAGWRIPARRPEYYPPGTAFADPALFAELDAALDKVAAKPLAMSFDLLNRARGGVLVGANLNGGATLDVNVRMPGTEEIRYDAAVAVLELELRRIFARHHIRLNRPLTPWDLLLTTAFSARPEQLCGATIALAPTYKPSAFTQPTVETYPHVGVQFRAMPYNSGRNSDIPRVLAEATATANRLGLPLLVYGHPGGTARPEGLAATRDLAGGDLLRFELGMLGDCRVMFSPESGWCDLMCWLQVPTVLERLGRPRCFTCMDVFHPRVILRDPNADIAIQVERLLAAREMLPTMPDDANVYDDTDWDGTWISHLMQEFVGAV